MKTILNKKNGALLLAIILVFSVLMQNYIPGIYGMPDEVTEEVQGQVSDDLGDAGQALTERMNAIEDDEVFAEVGKYVYDAVNSDETEQAPNTENEVDENKDETKRAENTDTKVEEENTDIDESASSESEENKSDISSENSNDEQPESDTTSGSDESKDVTEKTEGESADNVNDENVTNKPVSEENDPNNDIKPTEENKDETKTEDEQLSADKSNQDSITYVWQGKNDVGFAAWILDAENFEYIEALLKDVENEETIALHARINAIEDSSLYREVKQYVFDVENGKISGKQEDDSEEKDSENTDEEKTESEAIEKPENEEEKNDTKVSYPWDDMTDEEFAEWILCGENNDYIISLLKELAEQKKEQFEEENNEAVSEEDSHFSASESFKQRVEDIEDLSLFERIKKFLIELFNLDATPLEEQTLTDEEYGITVKGMLPDGATIRVEKVTFDEVEEFVGEGKKLVFAYDITIWVDDEEYQPKKSLEVTIPTQRETEKKVAVKHISENEETGEKTAEKVKSEISEDGAIIFSTDSFSIYMAVEEISTDEYIYFDLAAGNITISNDTYTGKIYTTTDGTTTTKTISGSHLDDNEYYVYQSTSGNRAETGEVDGDFVLPEYDEVAYNGNSWGEFITNNTDVEGVIDAWDAAASGRESTPNYINVTVAGKSCDLTIDNVWSTKNTARVERTDGGIAVTGAKTANTHVTVCIKGDNRMCNVFYASSASKKSSLTFTSSSGDGSDNGTLTVIGNQNTTTYTNINYKNYVGANFWNSVIGGNDGSIGTVYNLFFKGATIYAGSTPRDNCTAIGGGGNDMGNIIIDGGKITAVANTTGTAIGGGSAHTSFGGTSDVIINGGEVYAHNFGQPAYQTVKNFGSGTPSDVIREARHVAGTAIGGGSSITNGGNSSTAKVTITGGYVYAESLGGCAIGGGNSVNQTAGSANVQISGGTVVAQSIGQENYCTHEDDGSIYNVNPSVAIGGGRGGINGNGGSATVSISGDAKLITGSVGGGGTIKPDGKIGYAKVTISGGTTSGQFVMAAGASQACTFTMTGGVISDSHSDDDEYIRMHQNGGAVYMNDPAGVATISGGSIQNCSAKNGGAVYMTDGTFTISGTASIEKCRAELNGGAVCIGDETTSASGAELNVNGGLITRNTANGNGGGIALFGGEVTILNGEISDNITELNGGGAYVSGGNVAFSNGSILKNEATLNGGGIAVNNGSVIMSGGKADNNIAGGDGGGIYVSSAGDDVSADILSGSVSGNKSFAHGGAIAVVGRDEGNESISVVIGVNEDHSTIPFEHSYKDETYHHETCPEIKSNTASSKGGALFLSGGTQTNLDIYCVYEDDNTANDGETKHNFIMMEGGNCNISSSPKDDNGNFIATESGHGNAHISGTAYIVGGNMDIWGVMSNPSTVGSFTVNILADEEGNKGHFIDHRPTQQKPEPDAPEEPVIYKLHYYENFKGSGNYTAIDIPDGEKVTISGTIYSHPGYKIIGWYTNPDGTGDEYKVNSEYDPSQFVAHPEAENQEFLVIYAKWETHNYHVEFEPNPPEGLSYANTMDPMMNLEFDRSYDLPKCKFTCTGYTFTGWNTKEDGSGTSYADCAKIINLTDVKGDTVMLYAQWDKHEEPEEPDEPDEPEPQLHSYTYSVSDSGTTLIRTCICGIQNYAELSASDTTYNGEQQLQARIEYSSNDSSVEWKPELIHPDDSINAGEYEAYVEAPDGTRATITYTIRKASQSAPPTPEFTESKDAIGNSIYTITPVSPGHGATQYRLVYLSGANEEATEWSTNTTIEIPHALTNYHIEARYAGNANYKQSAVTPSSSVFYVGSARIEVTADEGIVIQTLQGEGSGVDGVDILYTIASGYHKTTGFKATVTESNASINSVVVTHIDDDERFNVSSIPAENCVIKIHVSGVEHDTVVTGYVAEGQIFGNISSSSASISRDSAFSVYFEIEYFNSTNYAEPTLKFGTALPLDSTIIMMDKTNSTRTYWHYTVESNDVKEIRLTDFVAMGGSAKFSGITGTNAKYQFIVDFSQTNGGCIGSQLNMSLFAEKISDNTNISNLNVVKTITLKDIGIAMSFVEDGLSVDFKLDFSKTFSASKWENRRAALVLKALTDLPSDACIEIVEQSNNEVLTTKYYQNTDNLFVLPIGLLNGKDITITLKSNMFPVEEKEYVFNCHWIASDTMSGTSPMCGDLIGEAKFTLLKEVTKQPSIKVESADGGKCLYALGETIKVKVSFENISSDLEVKATMMFKNEDGQYESFGLTQKVIEPDVITMPLSADTPGSYSILIEVEDSKGYTIAETPYYFIIQR